MATEKHLEFLQSAIGRMAGNSFQMKAWSVAIASATVGFAAAKDSNPRVAVLAVAPILAFWALDGYYLALEKLFRAKYDAVKPMAASDFDMTPGALDLPAFLSGCFRPAVALLHGPMIVLVWMVTLTGVLR